MIAIFGLRRCSALAWIFVAALACPAGAAELLGYVGPGAGLSMLGTLFGVLCVILLALLGPVLYPIGLLRTWLRKRRERRMSPTAGRRRDAAGGAKLETGTLRESCDEPLWDDRPEPGSLFLNSDETFGSQPQASRAWQ